MKHRRYCLFFYGDILGYKELLRHKTVTEIEGILRESISDVRQIISIRQGKIDQSKGQLARGDKQLAKFFRWSGEGVFSHYFAFDALLTFLRGLTLDGLSMKMPDFMLFCSSIYLTLLIKHCICLRGVIGLTSNYVIDSELVMFKEMASAHDLEKSQNWSGMILDISDEFLQYCDSTSASEDVFIDYPVPTKSGVRDYPVLNPLNKDTITFLRENSLSLSSTIARLEQESREHEKLDIKEKLENTVKFLADCRERYANALKWNKVFGEDVQPFDRVP